MSYLLGLLAAVLLGAGFVLQQAAAEQEPQRHFLRLRLLADLLRRPKWLAGLVTMVAGQVLSAWVLAHLVLSQAEPLLASNLLFALLLAWPLCQQRLTRREAVGAVILMAGIAALSVSRSITAQQVRIGSAAYWPFTGAAIAVLAYGLAAVARRRTGQARATLTGASAGVVFGMQDALTRHTLHTLTAQHLTGLLASWPLYALAAVGVTGVWLMQSAFSTAPLHASLPAITAGEPVTGMALGIVIFGDPMPTWPGQVVLLAAGLAALVAGVILVARGPALSAGCITEPTAHRGQRSRPAARHAALVQRDQRQHG